MLKSNLMVSLDRLLIAIGYKYNTRKVLYFISTEDTGITKAGIPCLYKYPYPFYNVVIIPVDHPICNV